MITARRWDCILRGIGWLAGVVDALVLMAAVLILIPRHVLALDSGAYVLLALYLANWLYVLAVVASTLTIIWLVIKAKTVCRPAALWVLTSTADSPPSSTRVARPDRDFHRHRIYRQAGPALIQRTLRGGVCVFAGKIFGSLEQGQA